MSTEKKINQMFFAITLNIAAYFHQIWAERTSINAEQRMLNISSSPRVCTHTTLRYQKRQNCDKTV